MGLLAEVRKILEKQFMTFHPDGSLTPSDKIVTAADEGWVGDAVPDKFRSKAWCSCGNPSGRDVFFDDGENPAMQHHHYRCWDCGAVTQTG